MAIIQSDINTFYGEALSGPGGAIQATGTITFGGQPSADDTLTVNGHAITFKASGATGQQVNIGGTPTQTATAVLAYLNTVGALTAIMTFARSGTTITATAITAGTGGNAYTLAKSGANPTISGANFTGGAATGPAGGFNVVGSNDGQMIAAKVDETWEDNVIAVLATLDATLALSQDPTADQALAKQQRKLLKDVLQAMSNAIQATPSSTDTRTAQATAVRKAGIQQVNHFWRPTGL